MPTARPGDLPRMSLWARPGRDDPLRNGNNSANKSLGTGGIQLALLVAVDRLRCRPRRGHAAARIFVAVLRMCGGRRVRLDGGLRRQRPHDRRSHRPERFGGIYGQHRSSGLGPARDGGRHGRGGGHGHGGSHGRGGDHGHRRQWRRPERLRGSVRPGRLADVLDRNLCGRVCEAGRRVPRRPGGPRGDAARNVPSGDVSFRVGDGGRRRGPAQGSVVLGRDGDVRSEPEDAAGDRVRSGRPPREVPRRRQDPPRHAAQRLVVSERAPGEHLVPRDRADGAMYQ